MKQLKKYLLRDRFWLKLLALLIALSLAYGLLLFDIKPPKTVATEPLSHWPFDKEAVLDYFFYRLSADCENREQIPDLGVMDNGSYSYGWVMFKQATFDGFGVLYSLPHDDIYSWEQQRAIFGAMLKDRTINWKHWLVCSPRVGLDKINLSTY